VRLIVPFAAAGTADLYARFLATRLQQALGQPFIVDDRPGAGSLIGTDAAAKSAPDGYTLLVMSNAHTVNESLIRAKPYQLMRDFVPVAPIVSSDLVLVARNGLPVKSVAELIQLARERPGGLTYASSGPGTPYHLAGELFKAMAGVPLVHVPYKGSAGARSDLLAGQVDLMFDSVTTMREQVRAGKVRALATTGRDRSAVMPELPTVAQAGVPHYEATIWVGLMAPRGTPAAIVHLLNLQLSRIVTDPDVVKAWQTEGGVPLTMDEPAFERYLTADIAKWARIVKVSGATPEQ